MGLLCAVWVVLVLVAGGRARSLPHCLTLALASCQGVACLGALLWSILDCRHGWRLYLQFVTFSYGVFGSRICTALLSLTMLLLTKRSPCSLLPHRPLLLSLALGLPALLVMGLLAVVAVETESHGDKTDPYFQYGATQVGSCFLLLLLLLLQAVVALIVLLLSLLTTLICLALAHRSRSKPPAPAARGERESLLAGEGGGAGEAGGSCPGEQEVAIEDLQPPGQCGGRYRCDSTTSRYCSYFCFYSYYFYFYSYYLCASLFAHFWP